jgi:hypothetical protein
MTNPNKVGLVIGALIGGWHLVWSILVLVDRRQDQVREKSTE